ncbi:MAG: DUF3793 family protein [Clostridia bacterium]|nr:DUF3793 family protein [Clostridia bacterium]
MEKIIAYHCAPALAGIKPSNLVSISKENTQDIASEIERLNKLLNCKDIYIEKIHECTSRVLAIVYRKKVLLRHLKKAESIKFLRKYGYREAEKTEDFMEILKYRLSNSPEFPHEIGVFLGYPINDIYGFIHHKNEGCLLCGEWRVYQNADEAKELFRRFKFCRNALLKRIESGVTLAEVFCTI